MKALLITFLTIVALPIYAKDHDPVKALAKVKVFAFGGIGFAGTISDGEELYDEILKRPTASADFRSIAETGTPEAKMYAMHGLARLAPQQYELLRLRLKPKTKVTTMSGCLMYTQTIEQILNLIARDVPMSPSK